MKAGKQYTNSRLVTLSFSRNMPKKKLDLKCEPKYRIIRLPTAWTVVIEHAVSGRMRRCNVGDLQKEHLHEEWQLKASNVGRAAKFVNHPSTLPEVEYTVDKSDNYGKGNSSKGGHNLRKAIKPKQRTRLIKVTHYKKKKKKR